ncbi:outer membrane beta-barrel protein, partial [Candidatus Kryptonium thompsonii]|uniref:outer membrane beta-barrel protein n=1 Tax=Candidatus Kryptonium thompsonii TaxID=1633631 RepID=UPI000707EFC8
MKAFLSGSGLGRNEPLSVAMLYLSSTPRTFTNLPCLTETPTIFIPENFKRNGFSLDEYKAGTNKYRAYDKNMASYLSLGIPFRLRSQIFNLATGFRVEMVKQNIYTKDFAGINEVLISKTYFDVLPAVEFKYSPTYTMNIKLSYSQTINKPELREISPFAYFDFYTQTSVRGDSS